MPSKSPEQARSPAFAKKVGIAQNVGREFVTADKATKGNSMATKGKMAALFGGKESKAEEAKEKKKFPGKKAYAKAEAKFEGEKMACGGKTKKYAKGGGIEVKGKTRGKIC